MDQTKGKIMSLPYAMQFPSGNRKDNGPVGLIITNISRLAVNEKNAGQTVAFMNDSTFNFIDLPMVEMIAQINEFLDGVE
jgi:hypothetical protein